MSEAASGSTLLTEGVGTPQGDAPATDAAATIAAPASSADWRAGLPEDVRGEALWQKYKTREDADRSHVSLEKMIGRQDRVPKPRGDDDIEGLEMWYKAGGRPDTPDEYAFERPNSLPDNFYDEAKEKSFKAWAHANGLSKKQAANLHESYVKTNLESYQAYQTSQKQASEQAQSNLRREWGAQYDAKINSAKAALAKYADPDYLREMDESGKGNDPRVIRAWARIGDQMLGSTQLKGAPQPEGSGDPKADIADFRTKYNDALNSKTHPDHELRVNQLRERFERAFKD